MAAKSKVYVIDPKSSVEALLQKGGVVKRGFERTEYSPEDEASRASTSGGSRSRGRRAKGPVEEQGSPIAALFSYLAGPCAILTTRHGREETFWVVLAFLSSILATFLFARSGELFAAPRGTGIAFVIWLSVACLAALMGFATWARAVYLLGRHKGHLLRKLPASLRHPGSAGVLGLVIPGFGLYASEYPKRAAFVIASICASVISVLVLRQAPDLWRLSRAGIRVQHGDVLERIFVVMGAIAAFGALVWIFQALDGMRLAGDRGENAARPNGDMAAVALVLAIAALVVTFKPARVAETLDRFAVSMKEDGLRIIPLAATQAAMRLDPSRPEYAMQAIELNEALGRTFAALDLRYNLEERWKPYERMLRFEAASVGPVEPRASAPAEP